MPVLSGIGYFASEGSEHPPSQTHTFVDLLAHPAVVLW